WAAGTVRLSRMLEYAARGCLGRRVHHARLFDARSDRRFRPNRYVPPQRVGHDLTEQQQAVLHVLGSGRRLALREIVAALGAATPTWSVRRDMAFLKQLGLVDSPGRGLGARWCLRGVPP